MALSVMNVFMRLFTNQFEAVQVENVSVHVESVQGRQSYSIESAWLENQMADAASERHRSSERSLVAADLAGRVLETLSPDDQLVLTLIDGEDASVKDVVKMTGWSESKVKVQAFRARRRMREAVEKLLAHGAKTVASIEKA